MYVVYVIGLAVSGGADSMALAYLCKQLQQLQAKGNGKSHSTGDGDLSVTAFVVDHKAREESSREARTVARWLEEIIGI